MLASLSLKAMVAIAMVHLSLSILASASDNDIQPVKSSVAMQRRSVDFGRLTRIHRHRRRGTNLPKPNGTSGAANNDEENVKLLEKYSAHLNKVNDAWQKQAMQDLKDGKTPILFDEFQKGYEKSATSSQTSNKDDNKEKSQEEKPKKDHQHHEAATKEKQDSKQSKAGDDSHKSDSEYDNGKDQSNQQQDDQKKKDQEKKNQEKKDQEKKDAGKADQEKQHQAEEQKKKDAETKKKEQDQKKKDAEKEQSPTNQDQSPKKGKSNASGPVAQYMGKGFDGDMTYYDVGLDACGRTDQPTGHTVAVATEWFNEFSLGDDNPNHNKICGQKIKIIKNGKTAIATIDDECPGCPGRGDLDMSQSLFEYFEDVAVGRCDVHWEFYNGN